MSRKSSEGSKQVRKKIKWEYSRVRVSSVHVGRKDRWRVSGAEQQWRSVVESAGNT